MFYELTCFSMTTIVNLVMRGILPLIKEEIMKKQYVQPKLVILRRAVMMGGH